MYKDRTGFPLHDDFSLSQTISQRKGKRPQQPHPCQPSLPKCHCSLLQLLLGDLAFGSGNRLLHKCFPANPI